MQINDTLISYLEELSCLTLSGEEKRRLRGDLENILGHMARLSGLEPQDIAESSRPLNDADAFRDDTVAPSLERELLLQNAPDKKTGCLSRPKR